MFGLKKSFQGRKPIITYSMLSENGSRAVNEDSAGGYVKETGAAFVLCDGLGGHGNGDIASQHVVESMLVSLQNAVSIEESIQAAQDSLQLKQMELDQLDSMKTTVTSLTIHGEKARYGHVGDSRIYHFEGNKLQARTLDHSVTQMLVNRGEIREEEIRFHEDRSKLIHVLGVPWNGPKYQVTDEFTITPKTTFLMVSDGFWELIDEKTMIKHLKRAQTPEEWIHSMEEVVKANGVGKVMDNYTAIAVFIR